MSKICSLNLAKTLKVYFSAVSSLLKTSELCLANGQAKCEMLRNFDNPKNIGKRSQMFKFEKRI